MNEAMNEAKRNCLKRKMIEIFTNPRIYDSFVDNVSRKLDDIIIELDVQVVSTDIKFTIDRYININGSMYAIMGISYETDDNSEYLAITYDSNTNYDGEVIPTVYKAYLDEDILRNMEVSLNHIEYEGAPFIYWLMFDVLNEMSM